MTPWSQVYSRGNLAHLLRSNQEARWQSALSTPMPRAVTEARERPGPLFGRWLSTRRPGTKANLCLFSSPQPKDRRWWWSAPLQEVTGPTWTRFPWPGSLRRSPSPETLCSSGGASAFSTDYVMYPAHSSPWCELCQLLDQWWSQDPRVPVREQWRRDRDTGGQERRGSSLPRRWAPCSPQGAWGCQGRQIPEVSFISFL